MGYLTIQQNKVIRISENFFLSCRREETYSYKDHYEIIMKNCTFLNFLLFAQLLLVPKMLKNLSKNIPEEIPKQKLNRLKKQ